MLKKEESLVTKTDTLVAFPILYTICLNIYKGCLSCNFNLAFLWLFLTITWCLSACRCGSGTYFGTLSGPLEAMSPLSVPRKPHSPTKRNVVTSPPKKGSAYRYMAICTLYGLCTTSTYNHGGFIKWSIIQIIKYWKMDTVHPFDLCSGILSSSQ